MAAAAFAVLALVWAQPLAADSSLGARQELLLGRDSSRHDTLSDVSAYHVSSQSSTPRIEICGGLELGLSVFRSR